MTVEISPQKASRILHHFFKGMPQPAIAQKTRLNQATVSRYASKFKVLADDIGLIGAAKEFRVMNEVNGLRSLAVELSRSKLTVEESIEGLAILRLSDRLGVPPARRNELVEVISKLQDPSFLPTAMKLVKLEAETGKSYTQLASEFERLSSETSEMEQNKAASKQENENLVQRNRELSVAIKEKKEQLKDLRKKAQEEESALEARLAKKVDEAGLTTDRVEKLQPLLRTLNELGIPDDKLGEYLTKHMEIEESGIGWQNFVKIMEGAKSGK